MASCTFKGKQYKNFIYLIPPTVPYISIGDKSGDSADTLLAVKNTGDTEEYLVHDVCNVCCSFETLGHKQIQLLMEKRNNVKDIVSVVLCIHFASADIKSSPVMVADTAHSIALPPPHPSLCTTQSLVV